MLPFCEKCHDVVHFDEVSVDKTKIIKGKEISYTGKEAYCKKCHSSIFVSEIRDFNLNQLDKAYRTSEDLITIDDINKVLDKYQIGKRPLSILLGWGEGTITRYINGDIPTKQYSDTLKRVFNDHQFFNELLQQNKGKVSSRAYGAAKKAVESLENNININVNSSNNKKIDSVVQYFLHECVDITPLSLQKLLYYAQSFYKTFYGEFLFQEDCEAWRHGPVYNEVYHKYKSYGYGHIRDEINEYEFNLLSETEIGLLDSIISNFGCYSGRILEKMTHNEQPWRITRQGLNDHTSSNRMINKKLISEYFEQIKSKYNMLNHSDIRDYSLDLFKKIN